MARRRVAAAGELPLLWAERGGRGGVDVANRSRFIAIDLLQRRGIRRFRGQPGDAAIRSAGLVTSAASGRRRHKRGNRARHLNRRRTLANRLGRAKGWCGRGIPRFGGSGRATAAIRRRRRGPEARGRGCRAAGRRGGTASADGTAPAPVDAGSASAGPDTLISISRCRAACASKTASGGEFTLATPPVSGAAVGVPKSACAPSPMARLPREGQRQQQQRPRRLSRPASPPAARRATVRPPRDAATPRLASARRPNRDGRNRDGQNQNGPNRRPQNRGVMAGESRWSQIAVVRIAGPRRESAEPRPWPASGSLAAKVSAARVAIATAATAGATTSRRRNPIRSNPSSIALEEWQPPAGEGGGEGENQSQTRRIDWSIAWHSR